MSHSFNKIWIHAVWSTKDWKHLILPKVEQEIHRLIRIQLIELGCFVNSINGMPDHVHCLFQLNPQKSIAEVIKQMKGSTSHTINQKELTTERFAWQTGYGAFSVSESGIDKVREYISNQKEHHIKKTFREEYEGFLRLHGLNNNDLNSKNG